MITGIPGHYVDDVVLENIKISYPGGGIQEDTERVVPENIARYPKQFFFGVLPSWIVITTDPVVSECKYCERRWIGFIR